MDLKLMNVYSAEDLLEFLQKELPNNNFIKSLKPTDLFSNESLRQRYDPSDDDIEYAIRNKFEVLIHGKYYAVNISYIPMIIDRI